MARKRKTTPELSRDAALRARPVKLDFLSRQELPDGGVKVTVNLARPKWHSILGSGGGMARSFELDYLGAEIYDACTGSNTVDDLVRDFGRRHSISRTEAEISVTKFLNTMMTRGLVAMDVKRQEFHA